MPLSSIAGGKKKIDLFVAIMDEWMSHFGDFFRCELMILLLQKFNGSGNSQLKSLSCLGQVCLKDNSTFAKIKKIAY